MPSASPQVFSSPTEVAIVTVIVFVAQGYGVLCAMDFCVKSTADYRPSR